MIKYISIGVYVLVILLARILGGLRVRSPEKLFTCFIVPAAMFVYFSFFPQFSLNLDTITAVAGFGFIFAADICAFADNDLNFFFREVMLMLSMAAFTVYSILVLGVRLGNVYSLIILFLSLAVPLIIYFYNLKMIPRGLRFTSFVFTAFISCFCAICICTFFFDMTVWSAMFAAVPVFLCVCAGVECVDSFRWEHEDRRVNKIIIFSRIAYRSLLLAAIIGFHLPK